MDLEFVESGNGGDLVATLNDLSVIYGLENMPYMALFGGNVEASTADRVSNDQALDWWANVLLDDNTPDRQMNSLTERTLMNVSLSSQGRMDIQNAVKTDLAFLKVVCQVGVSVLIVGVDKVAIGIKLIRLDNLQQREFIYLWDATMKELTQKERGFSGGVAKQVFGDDRYFDLFFDFSFN